VRSPHNFSEVFHIAGAEAGSFPPLPSAVPFFSFSFFSAVLMLCLWIRALNVLFPEAEQMLFQHGHPRLADRKPGAVPEDAAAGLYAHDMGEIDDEASVDKQEIIRI
jgi:hypothetical protein